MPKTKTPTLGAVAAAQDDEKKKAKGASLLTKALALLGLSAADAKMTKKTLVTKRTETEESDDSAEEEESLPMSTEKSSGATSGEESSSAEEEEEGAAASAEEEEEEKVAKGKRAESEEEEEEARAVAKGWKAAITAYAKATKGIDAYGIHGPKGLLRAAEKATGAKGAHATLTALHGLRGKAADAQAAVIQRLAVVEAKATKIEASSRKDRVEAMIAAAKTEGRAPSKALRAELRTYGNEQGTKKLASLIATLKPVPTSARAPKLNADGTVPGLPSTDEQAMLQTMFGDLSPDKRAEAVAMYEAAKRKNLNGASKAEA